MRFSDYFSNFPEPVRHTLDEISSSYQNGEITSAQCARRIRQLAENAVRSMAENPLESESLQWSAESLRARLRRTSESSQTSPTMTTANLVVPPKSKRPSSFWLFDPFVIYDELRDFLHEQVSRMDHDLTQYTASISRPSLLTMIQNFANRLRLAQDLDRTIPQRNSHNTQFRLNRNEMKKIVHAINQAITSTEMTDAYFREWQKLTAGSDEWKTMMNEATYSLERMIVDFQNLRWNVTV